MKILVDENLPRKFLDDPEGHECCTVVECGWSCKKNGQYQQDLVKTGQISILINRASSDRIHDLPRAVIRVGWQRRSTGLNLS